MSGGFDIKDLNRLAGTLAQGAEQLEGLAGEAPTIPDAGTSTAAVGSCLAALGDVMSKVVQTAAGAADRAQAGAKEYQSADDNARESMNGTRRAL